MIYDVAPNGARVQLPVSKSWNRIEQMATFLEGSKMSGDVPTYGQHTYLDVR